MLQCDVFFFFGDVQFVDTRHSLPSIGRSIAVNHDHSRSPSITIDKAIGKKQTKTIGAPDARRGVLRDVRRGRGDDDAACRPEQDGAGRQGGVPAQKRAADFGRFDERGAYRRGLRRGEMDRETKDGWRGRREKRGERELWQCSLISFVPFLCRSINIFTAFRSSTVRTVNYTKGRKCHSIPCCRLRVYLMPIHFASRVFISSRYLR